MAVLIISSRGASFFWVNHYFQNAPFYPWLLYSYSLVFLIAYFSICVRGRARSPGWKVGATLTAVVFTVAFIMFEMIGRLLVESVGLHEFWVMLLAYFGFAGLIGWRARATAK